MKRADEKMRTDDAFPPAMACDVAGKLFFAYTPPSRPAWVPWALNNQSFSHAGQTSSERASEENRSQKDPSMDYRDKLNDWRGLERSRSGNARLLQLLVVTSGGST